MGQIAAVRADLAVAALPGTFVDRDIGLVPPESDLPKNQPPRLRPDLDSDGGL